MPPLEFRDFTGGRNGIDSPLNLLPNQCQEAINISWFRGQLGGKRGGARVQSSSGGTPFSSGVRSQYRHVPDGDETHAEWWGVDAVGTIKRLVGGIVWEDVTVDDAITGNTFEIAFQTFNGKLFIAYGSDVNRLHVYDPDLEVVRRVGLAKCDDAPTVVDEGSGSYPAILRYYRVRTIQVDGDGNLVRRSEPSDAVSITPSGSGAGITITFPDPPDERETDWEVEVSLDGETWFVGLGFALDTQVPIATLTVDDVYSTVLYDQLPTSPEAGEYTLFPSVRYLSSDNNRLIGAGTHEDDDPTSRMYLTPVLGTSDEGDDERVQITSTIKGYENLNEKDGGRITGISLPIQGTIFLFKYSQIWKLVPTGDNGRPYIPRQITNVIGCIYYKTIVMAEDAAGNPVVGFLAANGPYRVGLEGIDYLGRDIDDQWNGLNGKRAVFLDAEDIVAHGVYYAAKREIHWWVAVGSDDSPSIRLVQNVKKAVMHDQYGVRGGWSIHTGKSCKAISSVMFSESVGASMGRRLVPYVAYKEP